jgi:hypothetical protein
MLPSRCEVNPATAVLQSTALVANDDIIEYSDDEHTFRLKDKAHQKIQALMDRTPFAVKALCTMASSSLVFQAHHAITQLLWM